MDKREEGSEGVSRFCIEVLSPHTTEKVRRGTFLCSRKILVSKKVKDNRGGHHDSPSKTCCLTLREKQSGEHSAVQKFSGIKQILWIRNGEPRLSVDDLLSHSTENFRRGSLLCCRKFLGPKNVKDRRGGRHNFP